VSHPGFELLRVDKTNEIISELERSYAAELGTLQNHLANSVDFEAREPQIIQRSLEESVSLRLNHARRLAKRISILGGRVPGSLELPRNQSCLQTGLDKADATTVLQGALRAIEASIAQYERIIALTEGRDYVTQDLLIDLLCDEREQHRLFSVLLAQNGTPTGASSSEL
jgi:bacterioferritin